LKLRAIVNGTDIYPLNTTKPVVIPVYANNPRLVITDGFHFTRPLKLVYRELPIYCFKVVCPVSDLQLLAGFIMLSVLYLGGLFSGMLVLKVFSFIPLIYLVMFYYLNRGDFLKLVPVLD
jgi:hypothetical protein